MLCCHVPHQSTVRRIEAVLRSRQGWQCHCCLCLTDPKRERFSCTSPERKKLNFKRESIISMTLAPLTSLGLVHRNESTRCDGPTSLCNQASVLCAAKDPGEPRDASRPLRRNNRAFG